MQVVLLRKRTQLHWAWLPLLWLGDWLLWFVPATYDIGDEYVDSHYQFPIFLIWCFGGLGSVVVPVVLYFYDIGSIGFYAIVTTTIYLLGGLLYHLYVEFA